METVEFKQNQRWVGSADLNITSLTIFAIFANIGIVGIARNVRPVTQRDLITKERSVCLISPGHLKVEV